MPYYRALGEMPELRHTLHHRSDGSPLFEEFIGEEGFSGTGSLLYHLNVPSSLVDSRSWDLGSQTLVPNTPLRPRHLKLPELFPSGSDAGADMVNSRRAILANPDVRISYVVAAAESPLYSNGIGDELVFIESGAARLDSIFGTLQVRQGDNVVIPRVSIHRWIPEDVERLGPVRAICVEGAGHMAPPSRYLSRYGQFLEAAPLAERSLRVPDGPLTASPDLAGLDTDVYVKHKSSTGVTGSVVTYGHHPFDVVGWDGCLYPYAFNYRDLTPVAGRILQPPPTYQVLEGPNFVVCNFVPRPLEFHPQAVKVPYYHSNVDSDEVMFYFAGETAARKGSGIISGSLSLHPAAYTHGPRRQAYLDSPAMSESNETAFMVDTFRPLDLVEEALTCEDPTYAWTWSGRGPGVVSP
jgi:homogentisate 1,2-dioxygenase